MRDLMMAACFENIEKAGEVGVAIGFRIDERVTHSRLRCEIYNMRELSFAKRTIHSFAIGQIAFNEIKVCVGFELGEARMFQRHIIIGIDVVVAGDFMAFSQEPTRDVKADKTGCAGDENA